MKDPHCHLARMCRIGRDTEDSASVRNTACWQQKSRSHRRMLGKTQATVWRHSLFVLLKRRGVWDPRRQTGGNKQADTFGPAKKFQISLHYVQIMNASLSQKMPQQKQTRPLSWMLQRVSAFLRALHTPPLVPMRRQAPCPQSQVPSHTGLWNGSNVEKEQKPERIPTFHAPGEPSSRSSCIWQALDIHNTHAHAQDTFPKNLGPETSRMKLLLLVKELKT